MDRGPKRSSVRLLQRHWRLKRQCWLWPGKTTSTSIGVFGWRKRLGDELTRYLQPNLCRSSSRRTGRTRRCCRPLSIVAENGPGFSTEK